MTGIDPDKLPERRLGTGTKLYRLYRHATGTPWYFVSGGEGRFDPIGAPDLGICYWAEDPLGAWIEVFRTKTTLTQAEVDERRLATLTLTDEVMVIDPTQRRSLAAGVTAALTSGHDYSDSQALASSVALLVGGIRWRARHDLAQKLISVGLFGPDGFQPEHLPAPVSEPIPLNLVEDAESTFGYTVLPRPSTAP